MFIQYYNLLQYSNILISMAYTLPTAKPAYYFFLNYYLFSTEYL